jgi:hypothetical protein
MKPEKAKRPAGRNGEALRHNAMSGKTTGAEATNPKNLAQQVRQPTSRLNTDCCWRAHYVGAELAGSIRKSPFGPGFVARNRRQEIIDGTFPDFNAARAAIEAGVS